MNVNNKFHFFKIFFKVRSSRFDIHIYIMVYFIYIEVILLDKIHIEGKSFVDSKGRERIFHGMNFIYTGVDGPYPRNYITHWSNNTLKKYSELGFNLIRLGIVWDGIEHEMGLFDEDYIRHISDFIDRCGKFDIYVYVVLYQKHYASFIDGGAGAPLWATDSNSHTYKRMKYEASQLEYFFSPAICCAFDNFWNNKHIAGCGIQERYAHMLNYILPRFNKKKAFLGIDFLNEPFPGKKSVVAFGKAVSAGLDEVFTDKGISTFAVFRTYFRSHNRYGVFNFINNEQAFRKVIDSAGNISSKFDHEKYEPFFNRMISLTQDNLNNSFIFKENNYCSNIGMASGLNKSNRNDIVFAPNGFDISSGTTADENSASNIRTDIIFDEHKKTQEKLMCPVIVGEWGRHSGGAKGLSHISHELEIFDQNKWSFAFFKFDMEIFEKPIINVLSRPFPIATAGCIDSFAYDETEKTFEMYYSQKRSKVLETEIYLPDKPKIVEADGEWHIESKRLIVNTGCGIHNIKILF